MSIQDELHAAGAEYARRLDEAAEAARLAGFALEARKESNATAFALAFEDAFNQTTLNTDNQE